MSAPGSGWLDCEVACDGEPRPLRLAVRLPAPATVADALQAARAAWPGAAGASATAVDWERARVGVWGEECSRERPLQPNDRVEVYRPLLHDPREARRRRAAPALRRRGR